MFKMMVETEGVIEKIVQRSEDVKTFYIKTEKKIEYKAGQFVMLKAQIKDKKIGRAYSVASINEDELIEITFKVCGEFTNYLNTLKEGDKLICQGPFGHFTLDKNKNKKLVLVATGTGITPIRSILRDLYLNKKMKEFEKITLIYGSRYLKTLNYNEEFTTMNVEFDNFEYIPILSREEEWKGKRGHVQSVVKENIDKESTYYICGLKIMAGEVHKILTEAGVEKNNIIVEGF
jgi:CDP-4-dehydro-6-deoxyglucose reductase, E3